VYIYFAFKYFLDFWGVNIAYSKENKSQNSETNFIDSELYAKCCTFHARIIIDRKNRKDGLT